MPRDDPSSFSYRTRAEALARHHAIAVDLADSYVELGEVRGAEREAKVNAFTQNPGTDKQRDHAASFSALHSTKEVWQIEGAIRALEEERDDIRWQLANGGYGE